MKLNLSKIRQTGTLKTTNSWGETSVINNYKIKNKESALKEQSFSNNFITELATYGQILS